MPARKTPTRKAIPASHRVEAHLRKAVYAGTLRPRQRIIEQDLARELGVSRGPVREALLRLERDGLVVTTPRRGTYIRDISPVEVGVIFRMRAKLEGLCVRYMRQTTAYQPDERLTMALEKLKAAAMKDDEEQFFQADMELHRVIWKASHQGLLYRTLCAMMNPYIFIIARVYSSRLPLMGRYENHARYVQLILNTPLASVEEEVERYFGGLYSASIAQGPAFPPYIPERMASDEPDSLY